MVRNWLSDENKGQWMMVVDNADDTEVIFNPSGLPKSLREHLPSSPNGSIVITTRNREVAEGLTEHANIFEVGPMTTAEATELLLRKLKVHPGDIETASLVHQLDCMPLAITQAAAFVNRTFPRMTLPKYVEQLRNPSNEVKMLQKNIQDPRRAEHDSNSIITWHTTFKHIQQTRTSAAQLLAFMSLFDRDAIPEDVLLGRYLDKGIEAGGFQEILDDDIDTLRSYSLIHVGSSKISLFNMHRLVQVSMQAWLEMHKELVGWQLRYAQTLISAFPPPNSSNCFKWNAWIPHVTAFLGYITQRAGSLRYLPEREDYLRSLPEISLLVLLYAYHNGKHRVAKYSTRTLLIRLDNHFDFQDQGYLKGMRRLICLQLRKNTAVAEALARAMSARAAQACGPDSLVTLQFIGDLAFVLERRGRYDQAEQLSREMLERIQIIKKKSVSLASKDLLDLERELSFLWAIMSNSQSRYEQAELEGRKALEMCIELQGPNDLSASQSPGGFPEVLPKLDEYEEAGPIKMTLEEAQKTAKQYNSDSLHTLTMLGEQLYQQGQYEEAEHVLQQLITEKENVFGADDPLTLSSVNDLAHTLQKLEKYERADRTYRRVMGAYSRVRGQTILIRSIVWSPFVDSTLHKVSQCRL